MPATGPSTACHSVQGEDGVVFQACHTRSSAVANRVGAPFEVCAAASSVARRSQVNHEPLGLLWKADTRSSSPMRAITLPP